MKHNNGFTLLEVLIALAIVAIAFSALFRATLTSIHETQTLQEKTIKHWVAMQAITMIQLNLLDSNTGRPLTEKTRYLNQDWFWQAKLSTTAIPFVDRIEVTISTKPTGPFTDSTYGFRYRKHG